MDRGGKKKKNGTYAVELGYNLSLKEDLMSLQVSSTHVVRSSELQTLT